MKIIGIFAGFHNPTGDHGWQLWDGSNLVGIYRTRRAARAARAARAEAHVSPKMRCCICDEIIRDPYGFNAQPVADGRCCESCDNGLVIPERFKQIFRNREAAS